MNCPICKKAMAEEAKFCPDCGAPAGAAAATGQATAPVAASAAGAPGAQVPTPVMAPAAGVAPGMQGPAPVMTPAPQTAPQAEARTGFGALSLPAQLAIGCGIPIVGVLLIVAVGYVVYLVQQRSHAPATQQATKTLDQAIGETTGGKGSPETATEGTAGLAGEWTVVYFSGEGDPPPSGLSLREENGEIVGELQGRYETKVRLRPVNGGEAGWKTPRLGSGQAAVPGGWAGTYADANMPSGTRISAERPGQDRLRIVDEDSPGGPAVLLVVDRPGGSDFGPHARAETKDEALDAVSADPKVADWLKEIEAAKASGRKTSAHLDIESDEGEWYIAHVYELVDDGGGQGHTATFGRYYVYKRSALVVPLEEP